VEADLVVTVPGGQRLRDTVGAPESLRKQRFYAPRQVARDRSVDDPQARRDLLQSGRGDDRRRSWPASNARAASAPEKLLTYV
jgi:hypothetical protein